MTKFAPEAPVRPKNAAELKNEYTRIRKQADKDLKDLNTGRKRNIGFFQFVFCRRRAS